MINLKIKIVINFDYKPVLDAFLLLILLKLKLKIKIKSRTCLSGRQAQNSKLKTKNQNICQTIKKLFFQCIR